MVQNIGQQRPGNIKQKIHLKIEKKSLKKSKINGFCRGSYNKYTKLIRKTAVEKVIASENFKSVSQEMKIPVKNLRRWVATTFLEKDGRIKRKSQIFGD